MEMAPTQKLWIGGKLLVSSFDESQVRTTKTRMRMRMTKKAAKTTMRMLMKKATVTQNVLAPIL
jgi:hypothetical protein